MEDKCQHNETKITSSKAMSFGPESLKQRRHECKVCGERFSTIEITRVDYLEILGALTEFKKLIGRLKLATHDCKVPELPIIREK